MVDQVGPLAVGAAHVDQVLGAPGVRAQEGRRDAQAARLAHLQGDIRVVAGQEKDIRGGAPDLGELGGKVLVAGGVGLEGHHLPAIRGEIGAELFCLAFEDIRGHVIEDRGPLGLEGPPGETAQDAPLEGVGETGPEHEALGAARGGIQRRLGVGGPGRDEHRSGLFGDFRRRQGIAAGVGSHDGQDAVAGDELLGDCRRLVRPAAAVLDGQFELEARRPHLQAPRVVDLLDRQQGPVAAGGPHGRDAAGEFGDEADGDRVPPGAPAAGLGQGHQGTEQNQGARAAQEGLAVRHGGSGRLG